MHEFIAADAQPEPRTQLLLALELACLAWGRLRGQQRS